MASHRCSVTAKQHDNKRLALLDGIERAVQSVNLQLGSLRRSQRFLAKVRDSRWLKQNCHERVRVANSKILFNQWRNEHPSRYRLGHNLTFTNFGQEPGLWQSTLVTNNTRHFDRIKSLAIENWASAAHKH